MPPSVDTASRLSLATQCAKKFEHVYVKDYRSKAASALIFGSAFHDGIEAWFGRRGRKPGDLEDHIYDAYMSLMPRPLALKVEEEIGIDDEAEKFASTLEAKHPRKVKAFTESDVAKELARASGTVSNWLEANADEIRWSKTDPPLKMWRELQRIAAEIEAEWIEVPTPLMVESSFRFEYGGYQWRGRIDLYGPYDPETGEVRPILVDWKTSKQNPSSLEVYYQAILYHMALTQFFEMPLEEIQFRMVRRNEVVDVTVDPVVHYEEVIARRRAIESGMKSGFYLPNYSYNCRNCDFLAQCESESKIKINERKLS